MPAMGQCSMDMTPEDTRIFKLFPAPLGSGERSSVCIVLTNCSYPASTWLLPLVLVPSCLLVLIPECIFLAGLFSLFKDLAGALFPHWWCRARQSASCYLSPTSRCPCLECSCFPPKAECIALSLLDAGDSNTPQNCLIPMRQVGKAA